MSNYNCIKDVKWLDGQAAGVPNEVRDELRAIWLDWELGNDHYFMEWEWAEMSVSYPAINSFLISQGLGPNNIVILRWWW